MSSAVIAVGVMGVTSWWGGGWMCGDGACCVLCGCVLCGCGVVGCVVGGIVGVWESYGIDVLSQCVGVRTEFQSKRGGGLMDLLPVGSISASRKQSRS